MQIFDALTCWALHHLQMPLTLNSRDWDWIGLSNHRAGRCQLSVLPISRGWKRNCNPLATGNWQLATRNAQLAVAH